VRLVVARWLARQVRQEEDGTSFKRKREASSDGGEDVEPSNPRKTRLAHQQGQTPAHLPERVCDGCTFSINRKDDHFVYQEFISSKLVHAYFYHYNERCVNRSNENQTRQAITTQCSVYFILDPSCQGCVQCPHSGSPYRCLRRRCLHRSRCHYG